MSDIYSVISGLKKNAVCIIKTTKAEIVPFNEVTADHAIKKAKETDPWLTGENCTRNDIYYFITVKDPNGVGKKIETIGEFLSSVSFSGTKF